MGKAEIQLREKERRRKKRGRQVLQLQSRDWGIGRVGWFNMRRRRWWVRILQMTKDLTPSSNATTLTSMILSGEPNASSLLLTSFAWYPHLSFLPLSRKSCIWNVICFVLYYGVCRYVQNNGFLLSFWSVNIAVEILIFYNFDLCFFFWKFY